MNDFYNANGIPLAGAPMSAREALGELRAITRACDMLPPLSGLGNRIVSLMQGVAPMDTQTYAVGTWTPAFTCTTVGDLNRVYSTQAGHYVRIGPFVYLAFRLTTSTFTHTTASGNAWISGVPAYYDLDDVIPFNSAYCNYTKAGYTQISFSIVGGNWMQPYATGTGVAISGLQMADLPTGTNLTWGGSGLYYTGTTP